MKIVGILGWLVLVLIILVFKFEVIKICTTELKGTTATNCWRIKAISFTRY